MKKFWKKDSFVVFHIDRLESFLGNVMVRGWAINRDKSHEMTISVQDGEGNELPVYTERLVREDVNAAFGEAADYQSGLHILIDRAVLNTPFVWLVFDNGQKRTREKIRINAKNALERYVKTHSKKSGQEPDYDIWIRQQEPDAKEQRRQRKEKFALQPKFSVVIPLYNTPREFLKVIMDSVLNQTYSNVELCLADGSTDDGVERYIKKHYAKEGRIRYCRLKKNRGISENTNSAMKLATGDFIVFSDHDDLLTPDAMYEMVKAINENPQIDVIYTDEDKINKKGNAYFGPHFKPDFSMELLCCNNYICHLFAVRKDVQEKVGMLDAAYDGAQDFDYVLRCCEQAQCICHIPKVLYHWRTHPESTAGNPASKMYAFEAGRRAVEAHYKRVGIEAAVENTAMLGRYRTRFAVKGEPLVSILIPNKDHVADLNRCLASIREKTTYKNYEILIIENNSVEAETEAYYQSLTDKRADDQEETSAASIIRYSGPFNYAAIHNFAVPYAKGEYMILLNNDTEVLAHDWIQEMLGICQKEEVGAVGAKLYYPDGTIQHAGVILGLCGVASHLFVGAPGDKDGYAGRLVSVQDFSAVTAACMMTKKSAWEKVGGMEERLAVAYNDIDYCLKLQEAGYRIVFTPYAELTHYESKTRGLEDTKEKQQRLQREADIFQEKWKEKMDAGDPYYNRNLSLTKTDCSLRAR